MNTVELITEELHAELESLRAEYREESIQRNERGKDIGDTIALAQLRAQIKATERAISLVAAAQYKAAN